MERKIKSHTCCKCGNVLDESWDFCPYCKTKIIKSECYFCKSIIKEEWNYCPICKNKINKGEKEHDMDYSGNEWLKSILKNNK